MPNVNIKGVGTAQFPDDMPINDIRAFLQKKFAQDAISGRSDVLAPAPTTAAPFTPTLPERMGQDLSDALYDSGVVSDRYGAQQVGSALSSIGEMLPVIGDAAAGDEFGRAVAKDDYSGMALAGLGVIPVAGDALKKAIRKVNDLEFEYKKQIAPLQTEFKHATPERKHALLKQKKELGMPLSAAKSELLRLEMAAKPKKKVVDEVIKPNKTFKGKVYHQTSEQFDDFDLNKGADGTVWFTGDKKNFSDPSSSASAASGKGRVLEREVELKKAAGFDELDKYSVGELKQMGYDGAVLDGDIQVFDAKAIKSSTPAVGN